MGFNDPLADFKIREPGISSHPPASAPAQWSEVDGGIAPTVQSKEDKAIGEPATSIVLKKTSGSQQNNSDTTTHQIVPRNPPAPAATPPHSPAPTVQNKENRAIGEPATPTKPRDGNGLKKTSGSQQNHSDTDAPQITSTKTQTPVTAPPRSTAQAIPQLLLGTTPMPTDNPGGVVVNYYVFPLNTIQYPEPKNVTAPPTVGKPSNGKKGCSCSVL
ncbi:hypothetical protein Nepgr_009636 [Nepenthes gracilis]|uniref:Uncharacterized protein n=1 Tax=Nepenthes gracilis TaxID=150966 RepID=A0AAD3SBE8_NEPGR|nr:hypothetical protein Nepgr_009636 [Nepenthes gracilis]